MKKLITLCAASLVIISVILVFSLGCQENLTAPETPARPTKPLTVPGRSYLVAAKLFYEDTIELQAGETKTVEVKLETREDGPGEFSGTLYRVAEEYSKELIPMPGGLEVRLEPSEFTAYPSRIYTLAIIIETTPELAPGEYVLFFKREIEKAFSGSGWIKVNVK